MNQSPASQAPLGLRKGAARITYKGRDLRVGNGRNTRFPHAVWAKGGRYLRFAPARATAASRWSPQTVSSIAGIAIAAFVIAWFAAHFISGAAQ